MLDRYKDKEIESYWTDEEKVRRWQETELAVIEFKSRVVGNIPAETIDVIKKSLESNPCDLNWWKEREKILHHDLNAWIEERLRFIPEEQQRYFHQGLTSYDTEEPAFALTLKESLEYISTLTEKFEETLRKKALEYRYLPMNERTHGQEAELKSFGARCLSWLTELKIARDSVNKNADFAINHSKLSGAVGTYSGISWTIEKGALEILGLKPLHGATQIMPRVVFAPIASALAQMVSVLEKIAVDIRLGARSGRPLWHEPFGKKQKGSSAMPHKKNTILTEKISGMARMARSYASGIELNTVTWEARAIEQSSVERVFWPDLFHVTAHALLTMIKVLQGLTVYPDNMLREIIDSHGTYVSNEAKEFLASVGETVGISREDAYRIIQLASFIAFAPTNESLVCRNAKFSSNTGNLNELLGTLLVEKKKRISIREIVMCSTLVRCDELDADLETIVRWKQSLVNLFISGDRAPDMRQRWSKLFDPDRIFERESILFEKI